MSGPVISRSKLVGLKVYTHNARYVGDVKDIGFSLGETQEIHLVIETGRGEIEVPVTQIAAIGDIVLLKEGYTPPEPEPKQAPRAAYVQGAVPGAIPNSPSPQLVASIAIPRCPNCGHALVYYPKKKKWYCPNCKKYVKPSPPGVEARVPRCPTCGNPLSYIEQYGKWYCYNCQKYVEVFG